MKTILKTFGVLLLCSILSLTLVGRVSAVRVVRYVDMDATGSNNGTSWTNAYTSLQTALTVAVSGQDLWVAAGTYKPTTGTDRNMTFTLKPGVSLYGGFGGWETSFSQRNVAANLTLLSGDTGHPVPDWADNSYHVVTSGSTSVSDELDGFTISYGSGESAAEPIDMGGGIYNVGGSPTMRNITVSTNRAEIYGAGMYNDGGSPRLTNVIFIDNVAFGSLSIGGGMYNNGSSPILNKVTFANNTAVYCGGGMVNEANSNPTLTNVLFTTNSTSDEFCGGGGMNNYSSSPILNKVTFSNNHSASNGGGMINLMGSSPSLTNVTFSGNQADYYGGGIFNSEDSSPILKNVTISGNTAGNGGGIYNDAGGYSTIRNSIIWGNGTEIVGGAPQIYSTLVQGGCPIGLTCPGPIINSDPLLDPLAFNGGFTPTMSIPRYSPAIDAGNNATCASVDQRGVSRPQDGDFNSVAVCDMGAFEYEPLKIFLPVIRR